MNIREILKQSEGKTLEFKLNTSSTDRIAKTIITFANTAGEKLLLVLITKHVLL